MARILGGFDYEIALVDVTKNPIERLRKAKAVFTQKKRYTLKSQVVVDKKNRQAICASLL